MVFPQSKSKNENNKKNEIETIKRLNWHIKSPTSFTSYMRLLKYPLELAKGENLVSLVLNGPDLVLLSNQGNIIVWKQLDLINTANDVISLQDLKVNNLFNVALWHDDDKGEKNKLHRETFCIISLGNDNFLIGTELSLHICSSRIDKDHTPTNVSSSSTSSSTSSSQMTEKLLFSCQSPTVITDIKLDYHGKILFILTSNPNEIILYDITEMKILNKIKLSKINMKPMTCITDPMNQIFTIFTSDRTILIYQYNNSGNYKLINKLLQFNQMNPLHYKITMPPQANMIPVINSVKGTSTTSVTSTVLLDRNNNFKISSTIVSPASNTCKVLKYSPIIYGKTNLKKNKKTRYNLLATSGSKTGSILVWNNKRNKPLFNALQISDSPINDMIWSQDGLTLFAISNDNTLYTFAFQQNDLGESLNNDIVLALQNENRKLPILEPLKVDEVEKNTNNSNNNIPQQLIKQENSSDDNDIINKSSNNNKLKKNITDSKKSENETNAVVIEGDSKEIINNKINNHNRETNNNIPGVKNIKSSTMEFNPPSYNVPKDLKRKPKDSIDPMTNAPIIMKKQKKELEQMDFLDTNLLLPNVSFSRIRLASPKIRLKFNYSPVQNKNLEMSIRNGSGNEQLPTIVTLRSKLGEQDNKLFENYLPKFVTMCTSGKDFWSVATTDGTLYILSDNGQRISPPIILGVPISFLEANDNFLLAVTSLGELYCWNINQKKLLFPVNSVFPILNPSIRYSDDVLTRAENITMCAITKTGVPLITLSNGDGYMFDKDMETWLLVSDSWWAYGSQYWDMTNTTNLSNQFANADDDKDKIASWNSDGIKKIVNDIQGNNSSIINYMERKTNDELNRKNRIKNLQKFARAILMKEGFEDMEEIVTLSHLENRILVSLKLEEVKEFNNLMIVYCVRLGELGYTDRLNDVLQWIYNDNELDKPLLKDLSRKKLLKDILFACAEIRHVQRITTEYASAVGIINDTI